MPCDVILGYYTSNVYRRTLTLKQMSENKQKRILLDIAKLQDRQLLNAESFREVLARVSVSLAPEPTCFTFQYFVT